VADLAEVVPGRSPVEAAAAVLADPHLAGWLVTTRNSSLAGHLVRQGAAPKRHALLMQCDVRPERPPVPFPDPLSLGPLPASDDRNAWLALLPSWRAAFPPDHPDHFPGDDDAALAFMRRLIDGSELGPLHRASAIVHDDAGRPVAGVMVNVRAQDPPWGGPWIADIWRDPDLRATGVGTALIAHVLATVHDDGLSSVSLAVTQGNPAQRSYERAGFRVVSESHTVLLPG
jgi:ribosomal protein S18 acetylase RimI-like enzyme